VSQHRTRRVVLYNFPPSVALRTALTISRSSSIFSRRLTCYHPSRRHPHQHRTRRVLLAIIHAAGILIDIVLVASCSHPRRRPPHRHPTRRVVLYNFPLSVALRTALTISRSSSIFSPRLTCYHPRRRPPHRHPTRRVVLYNFPLSIALRTALTISRSSSIFSRRLTCYHPCRRHPHRHPHCHRTRRVLLIIVLAAGIPIGILFIDVVLIASCLIRQTAFVTVTQSDAIYGDVVYRCTLDVMNRTGLSHNAWNQMSV